MGISIEEFRVAMETYGATRLADEHAPFTHALVPCFKVNGVRLLHSGTYYIIQTGFCSLPAEIRELIEAECEEKPEGNSFWYREIHSVRGILCFVSALEGKYQKEYVDELIDKTYQRILKNLLLVEEIEKPNREAYILQAESIKSVIDEYDSLVNPFANHQLALKAPKDILREIHLEISVKEENAELTLHKPGFRAEFYNHSYGWTYMSSHWRNFQTGSKDGYVEIGHFYTNGLEIGKNDEVLFVTTDFDGKNPALDLRVSLRTGLAWKSSARDRAKPVTKKQLKLLLGFFQKESEFIKKQIIINMVT